MEIFATVEKSINSYNLDGAKQREILDRRIYT
jgi:hypothetical protein